MKKISGCVGRILCVVAVLMIPLSLIVIPDHTKQEIHTGVPSNVVDLYFGLFSIIFGLGIICIFLEKKTAAIGLL